MTDAKVAFAWTATSGYKHFPPYVNLTGNRLAVRGPETFNGKYYEHGLYAAVELPPEAIAELRAALEQSDAPPSDSDTHR
jgi:hypothetical protein